MLKYTPRGMIGKMKLKLGLNLGVRIHVRWKLNLEVKYVMRMRDHYLLSPPTGFE